MRRAFCFSRRCRRDSLSFLRAPPGPPRGGGRVSVWALRGPRQVLLVRLVSGRSDPAALLRAAAVVRLRRDVLDLPHLEAGGLQRADRGLPARAGALDEDVDLAHAVLLRLAGRVLGGHLRGERGRLARALEADVAGGGPA